MRSLLVLLLGVVLPLGIAAGGFLAANTGWAGSTPNGEPAGPVMITHCSGVRAAREAEQAAAIAAAAAREAAGGSIRGVSVGGGGWSGGK